MLVADGDSAARERLRRLLVGRTDLEVVAEAHDGLGALRVLEAVAIDLVFIDVALPGIDGFSVAAAIPMGSPSFVFSVGEDVTMRRALVAADLNHVTKPVTMQRFGVALARVRIGAGPRQVPMPLLVGKPVCVVRDNGRYVVLEIAKLAAVTKHEGGSVLLAENTSRFCDESFDRWLERLDPKQFLRVHGEALVNREHVKFLEYSIDGTEYAVLSDKAESRIPISREVVAHIVREVGAKVPRRG